MRCGHAAALPRPGSSRPRRELRQAESGEAERRARVARDRSDEIVGCAACRANDERFGSRRKLLEECPGGAEPGRC